MADKPNAVKKIRLPLRAKSLDAIHEDYRDRYEEKDGEFVLSQDIEVEDVKGLKGALDGQKAKVQELNEKYRPLADLVDDDFNVDEYKTLKSEKIENDRKKAEEKGEYQRLMREKDDKHAKEIERLNGVIKTKDTIIEGDAIAIAVADQFKSIGASVDLLGHKVLPNIKLVKDEHGNIVRDEKGIPQTFIADEKGAPKIGKAGDMQIAEFAATFKEDPRFAPAFVGSESTGADFKSEAPTTTTSSVGGSRRPLPKGIDLYDGQQYNRLQAQADKEGVTFVDAAGAIAVAPAGQAPR